ncbi:hypothetical protein [Microbacterium testaceum]|uniref:hypothetical protein n=1 Tax=Microbacterium testaceum TaxID=2033 RepID=UPI00128ED3F4|nr:hypothetical protein [Microbacterium testaceum]
MIAAPSRFHWYVRESGTGAHVPGAALRVDPTVIFPLYVGMGSVVKVRAGMATGELVRAVVVYPGADAVTVRVIAAPASAAATRYVVDVAPEIAAPPRFH